MIKNRLTHKRESGIKTGYWSPNKKDELVERLAEYENIGFNPEEIKLILQLYDGLHDERSWRPADAEVPVNNDYVLLSFENCSILIVGRYEEQEDGSGNWYLGDCDGEDTCLANDLFVNAWMPLPKRYVSEVGDET